LEQGVGVWSDNLHTLGFKVRSLLEQPGRLAAMRKNALRVARPDAGPVIARFVTSGQAGQ
jgi:UDP-N-acetylglucosamine:LPS N-acetylglucosamine transferase